MHTINTAQSSKLSLENIILYSEQLSATSSWCIFDAFTQQVIFKSKSFENLFACDCTWSHDTAYKLSITQDSYDKIHKNISDATKLQSFVNKLVTIETICGKMITLWLSAQAIIVENIVIAVILYADLLNIPKYLTSFLQKTYIDNPHNSEISAKILTTTSNNTSLNNIHNNEQNKNHVEALKNNNHTVLMTPNEKNVLDLIIAGFSQKEIAKKLQISRTRITQHIAKICNKCGYTGYSSKYLKKYFADTVSV